MKIGDIVKRGCPRLQAWPHQLERMDIATTMWSRRSPHMASRRVLSRCRTDHVPHRAPIQCPSQGNQSPLRRDHPQCTPATFIPHPHPCKLLRSPKAALQMYRIDICALSRAVGGIFHNRRCLADTSKIFTRREKYVLGAPSLAPSHPSHIPAGGPTSFGNISKSVTLTPRSRFQKFDKGPRNPQRRARSPT
jgi:hypothetical protein